jgi:hypothetical protein
MIAKTREKDHKSRRSQTKDGEGRESLRERGIIPFPPVAVSRKFNSVAGNKAR